MIYAKILGQKNLELLLKDTDGQMIFFFLCIWNTANQRVLSQMSLL